MYNFTIIIPHHSIPQLLVRCLKSIPHRNDIQVVVVDDNSDGFDKSIFSSIGLPHLQFVELKESRGAGGARNEGLKVAKGKWLLFADADDFFNENIENVLESQVDSLCDLIVFDSNAVLSETMQPTVKRDNVVCSYKKNKDENLLRYKLHTVWGKIFRKEIVDRHKICFSEVPASNDVMFAGMFGYYAKKIFFIDIEAYCCTTRSGSICTKLSYDNLNARFEIALQYNSFLLTKGIHLKYGENAFGFAVKLCRITSANSIPLLYRYYINTPMCRIMMDIKDSIGNFVLNLIGINKDKDMKKLKTFKL